MALSKDLKAIISEKNISPKTQQRESQKQPRHTFSWTHAAWAAYITQMYTDIIYKMMMIIRILYTHENRKQNYTCYSL